jgi:curli biogenesis system outer membrane secretion channel CsgG
MSRELRIVETATGKVVHAVEIQADKSERQVEKVLSGMLHRIDVERFHIEDSADIKEPSR